MPTTPKPLRLSEQKSLGLAIKRLRKRADLTQEEAAARSGVVVQSWRRYEWGERDLSLDKLANIARAIGVSREEILEEQARISSTPVGLEAPVSPQGARVTHFRAAAGGDLLPIRDRVQAGAWLAADDMVQDVRTYPACRDPRFPHADQWLSEVVGDSVNRLNIFEGDLVHCVAITDIGYYPRTGDIVEVERLRFGGQERELTIKQIEVTEGAIMLWPRSNNPRWQSPLELREGAGEDEDIEVRIRALVIASIRRF